MQLRIANKMNSGAREQLFASVAELRLSAAYAFAFAQPQGLGHDSDCERTNDAHRLM